ncbi:non-canonical purine NTP pyrophosphatase, RdgB/HAM1 family [Bacteroidales bacterium 6E]|nr:non-canonical purine NTP pyrophosphatase, RdgB/HAM1 family [Bacteroidales bacterium 6E]
MKLVFATNNPHKMEEIRHLLGPDFEILSLEEIGCNDEIPEDKDTLEENASQKAYYIFDRYKVNCFADDTGLEIDALNGEPGVFSARYAGPQRNSKENVRLVLQKMDKINHRNARFRTVISLILDGIETRFEGIVNGVILKEERGERGFGYDPIFQPEESDLAFAEMSLVEKNMISHRGRAISALVDFLKSTNK